MRDSLRGMTMGLLRISFENVVENSEYGGAEPSSRS